MQDSYVGDIGDLAKLGLLRALSKGERQLGVAWYLYPHEEGPDGQHIGYLGQPNTIWRPLDPDLFDGLQGIIARWRNHEGERSVMDAAYRGLLPGAIFADELLCHHPRNNCEPNRELWRHEWFERVRGQLQDCNIVFADPDNGFCENNDFHPDGRNGDWKRLPLREALALAERGRTTGTTVFYHHNGRRPGGVCAEIRYWMGQLPGCTHAFRCRRYGNRTFFVLNADNATVDRLEKFVGRWKAAERMAGFRPAELSQLIAQG